MKWKTVPQGDKVEVWVESDVPRPKGTLLWGIVGTGDAPQPVSARGLEGYGLDRDIFSKYSESIVRPAIENGTCDLDQVFAALENYLKDSERYAPLLALMTGRIHLSDSVQSIDSRLTDLVIGFVSMLVGLPDGMARVLVASWCYNLVNALFVAAGNRETVEAWVARHRLSFDKNFVEGLLVLAELRPSVADYCALLDFLVRNG
jgi:hypothetical protein